MSSLRFVLLALAALIAASAGAQTTYRWVDQNGRTIYSDQLPPPNARQVSKLSANERGETTAPPLATRQAMEKFPVVLYTAASCTEVCKQARDLLNQRGVPFTEKMLKTDEEVSELSKQLGSEALFPSIAVGRQNFKGLEATSWNNLLDLAGYPKTAPYGAKPSGAFSQ